MRVLITGANRGLGLEFCRQYLAAGADVIATCRDPVEATSLQALHKKASLELVALDVTNQQQRHDLAARLNRTPLDLLINNAGVYGGKGQVIGNCTEQSWLDTFRINTIAPLLLTGDLLPALAAAQQPKVVFITSKMGSVSDNNSGTSYIYRSSKAALNASIKSLSIDLADQVTVLALHPGWVQTDMGGPDALITSAESVSGMREVIEDLSADKSGSFVDYQGNTIPW